MTALFRTLSPTAQAVILALIAYLCFACADTIAKMLTQDYSVFFLMSNNVVSGLLVIGLLRLINGKPQNVPVKQPILHGLRGIANFCIVGLIVYSLQIMPIADVYTMVFSAPFWAVLIAVFIYKERLTRPRIIAIAAGFAGILIAMQPNPATFNWALIFPLGAAIFVAFIFVSTRSIKNKSATALGAYPLILGGLIALPFAAAHFEPIAASDIPLFIVNAIFVGVAMPCLSLAYSKAATALVSPIQYTQMIWGTILGFVFFGDIPTTGLLLGATVVIVSGIYLTVSERRKV